MNKQEAIAKLLGRYVMSKIVPLQKGYCGNGATSDSRARLARLRRLNSNAGSSILLNGEELFYGWPEEQLKEFGASEKDEARAMNTAKAVLGLYAFHQQSLNVGCAVVRHEKESDDVYRARLKKSSFGKACRAINTDLSEASGVQRRLVSIEGASNFGGVMVGVRSLVALMKSSRASVSPVEPASTEDGVGFPQPRIICLDYGGLTKDLYLMQVSESWRGGVLTRWARDYYAFVGPVKTGEE